MLYQPKSIPGDASPTEIQRWVYEELQKISQAQGESIALELRQRGTIPAKPREGMIASADGVGWDPGVGPGAYEYLRGRWTKLGGLQLILGQIDAYVETTGSDTNDGKTIGTAYRTINRALDDLYHSAMRGFPFRIHVGTGTFPEQLILSPAVGVDDLWLIGNGYTNTIIKPTNNHGTGLGILALNHFSRLIVDGIHLDASDPGWAGWECLTTFTGRVTFNSTCKMTQLANDGWYVIRSFGPGSDIDGGPLIVDMPGNQAACFAISDSFFETGGLQFISNTAFSEAFITIGGSTVVFIDKPVATGTVTGKRFSLGGNAGFIDFSNSGDPNFFPGNVAGDIDATSWYSTTTAGAMWGGIKLGAMPTTTDMPMSGTYGIVKDTVSGTVVIAENDSGTIVSRNLYAVTTVAGLPAAGKVGRERFVSDANATTFASIVAGGGANKVPVYDDGTNWRIG